MKVIYLTWRILDYFLEGRKKILVAPINWGLGHAAHDIPIIQELLKRNCEVLIATDGRALELLRKEFPDVKSIRLSGYDIRYHRQGNLAGKISMQLPKFFRSIRSEKKWLRRIIAGEKIDAVISDNRYGLYNS